MRRAIVYLIGFYGAGLLFAISLFAEVGGPVLGYVASADGALRPLLGIPGATTWGKIIADLPHLEPVAISNRHGYAVGVAESGEIKLLSNLAATPQTAVLERFYHPVSRVVLSPAETAAALHSGDGAVAIWSGLPQRPHLLWSGFEPAQVLALAVADDGEVVLAVTAEQGLWTVTSQGPRFLTSVSASANVAFLTDSHDAVISDGAANEILLLRSVTGAVTVERLAGEQEGVVAPVAIAASSDNRDIVVVNSEPHGILIVGLEDHGVIQLPCPGIPDKLVPFSGTATFRVSDEPLRVLDGDAPQPRIVSVPPPSQDGGSQ